MDLAAELKELSEEELSCVVGGGTLPNDPITDPDISELLDEEKNAGTRESTTNDEIMRFFGKIVGCD